MISECHLQIFVFAIQHSTLVSLKFRTTPTKDNVKIVQRVDLTIICYFVLYKVNLSIALTLISNSLSVHDLLDIC